MKNKIKSEIQEEALKKWNSNNCKGTLCLCTGAGKTRIGILAAMQFHMFNEHSRILIVTPTTNLRDKEWHDEFIKWVGYVPHTVQIECIHTAYKFIGRKYDLIIIDEIHMSFGEKFKQIYEMDYDKILGLTATPPIHREDGMKILNKVAPIIYELTLERAVTLGIVSPFKLYNLEISFTASERGKYAKYNSLFNDAKYQLNDYIKSSKLKMSAFDLANIALKDDNHIMNKSAKQFWQFMQLRKWACYNASKKLTTCVEIINRNPDKKWIIFCKSKKFAEELSAKLGDKSVYYHSGQTKEQKKLSLESFNNDKANILCSVEALKQGFNIPKIDAAICAAGDSVSLSLVQKIGRSIRFVKGKQSIFINLYVKNSQEKVWVTKATKDMSPEWVIRTSSGNFKIVQNYA